MHFGTIAYALDDVPQLLKGWAEAMASAPDELTTTLVLMPGFGAIPAGAILFVCHCGDDLADLEPLRSIGTVVAEAITERPYAQVLEEPHAPEGIVTVVGNTLVEELTGDVIDAIAAAYSAGGRVVSLRSLGGAFGRVDPAATAFAHRSAQAMVITAKFLPPGSDDDAVAAARAEWQTIRRHGIGSYAGFLDTATEEDLAALYPPETLERLVAAKRAWDPDNVFRRNFNIAP